MFPEWRAATHLLFQLLMLPHDFQPHACICFQALPKAEDVPWLAVNSQHEGPVTIKSSHQHQPDFISFYTSCFIKQTKNWHQLFCFHLLWLITALTIETCLINTNWKTKETNLKLSLWRKAEKRAFGGNAIFFCDASRERPYKGNHAEVGNKSLRPNLEKDKSMYLWKKQ